MDDGNGRIAPGKPQQCQSIAKRWIREITFIIKSVNLWHSILLDANHNFNT
jgi:hypothetical protein